MVIGAFRGRSLDLRADFFLSVLFLSVEGEIFVSCCCCVGGGVEGAADAV